MNWQKMGGAGLAVMATVSVWREFGPRTYVISCAGKCSKGHVVVNTGHPLLSDKLKRQIRVLGDDNMVVTSITRA